MPQEASSTQQASRTPILEVDGLYNTDVVTDKSRDGMQLGEREESLPRISSEESTPPPDEPTTSTDATSTDEGLHTPENDTAAMDTAAAYRMYLRSVGTTRQREPAASRHRVTFSDASAMGIASEPPTYPISANIHQGPFLVYRDAHSSATTPVIGGQPATSTPVATQLQMPPSGSGSIDMMHLSTVHQEVSRMEEARSRSESKTNDALSSIDGGIKTLMDSMSAIGGLIVTINGNVNVVNGGLTTVSEQVAGVKTEVSGVKTEVSGVKTEVANQSERWTHWNSP